MYKLLTKTCKIIFLFLLNYSVYAYAVDGLKVHNPDLFKYVQEYMPKTGTLRITNKGFVYIDLDDNHVMQILKQLKDSRYAINRSFSNVGSHISVMYEDESKGKKIKEFGKKFSFTPLGFYTMVMDDREYFMLAVDSPELAKLRQRYGLSPKLNGHTFHVTLGVRKYEDGGEDELADLH